MTENITPINIETSVWMDLAEESNKIYDAISNSVVSTTNPVVGDIELIGQMFATGILEGNNSLIATSATINTTGGLTGGENLNVNVTINLEPSILTNLNKAASSLQPGALDSFAEDIREISVGSGMIGGGRLNANVSIGLDSNTMHLLDLASTSLQPGAVMPGYELGSIIYTTRVIGEGWDIDTATYSGKSLNFNSQEPSASQGIFFKPDGTKMYIAGQTGPRVHEYNLSTPWNVSTAVYSSKFFLFSQGTNPVGLSFKPDGTKMFIMDFGNKRIYEYNISTPWDISTTSYSSKSFSINSQDATPWGMFFKFDGAKMYMVGTANKSVFEYNLSTPWDISTASYSSKSFLVSSQDTNPTNISFKPDGTRMYMVGSASDRVYEYNLSIPWDTSTTSYSTKSFLVSTQETTPYVLTFKPDGTRMYISGSNKMVFEYNMIPSGDEEWKICKGALLSPVSDYPELKALDKLPYFEPWDISSAVYSSKFISVNSQDTAPRGIFFKSDGTKMYMVGVANNRVYEYNLSTPWDISTATYSSKYISVAIQDTNPRGIFFKPDGTKMYMVGVTNDRVYEYDLSTAWDISTATYSSKSFLVGTQDTQPFDLFFKPDGTKMYMIGVTNGRVYEYNLSTAWDISTATYSTKFISVAIQDTSPYGISFKPDGTKMYMIGATNKTVYEYNLSTAWDISTATYSSKSFLVGTQDSNPSGISFKPDGTKMYMIGATNKTVYEYNLEGIQLANITTPDPSVYPYLKVTS